MIFSNAPQIENSTLVRKTSLLNAIKPAATLFTLVCVAAFAVGCDREPSASQQIETLKMETKEAAQDMKDYTYAEKGEFSAKMHVQLAEINRDLETLSAKIESSSDAVKAEAKPKLQLLREQSAQLTAQLSEVENATESTWDGVKAGTRKTYDALKDGFQQSRQWLSEKIAP